MVSLNQVLPAFLPFMTGKTPGWSWSLQAFPTWGCHEDANAATGRGQVTPQHLTPLAAFCQERKMRRNIKIERKIGKEIYGLGRTRFIKHAASTEFYGWGEK